MSVRHLLSSLDQQRSRFRLEGDLNDVLRIVQHLNSVCRTGPLGPNHYFSASYASQCCALPFLSAGEGGGGPLGDQLADQAGRILPEPDVGAGVRLRQRRRGGWRGGWAFCGEMEDTRRNGRVFGLDVCETEKQGLGRDNFKGFSTAEIKPEITWAIFCRGSGSPNLRYQRLYGLPCSVQTQISSP